MAMSRPRRRYEPYNTWKFINWCGNTTEDRLMSDSKERGGQVVKYVSPTRLRVLMMDFKGPEMLSDSAIPRWRNWWSFQLTENSSIHIILERIIPSIVITAEGGGWLGLGPLLGLGLERMRTQEHLISTDTSPSCVADNDEFQKRGLKDFLVGRPVLVIVDYSRF